MAPSRARKREPGAGADASENSPPIDGMRYRERSRGLGLPGEDHRLRSAARAERELWGERCHRDAADRERWEARGPRARGEEELAEGWRGAGAVSYDRGAVR